MRRREMLALLPLAAAGQPNRFEAPDWEERIPALMQKTRTPGVSIAIIENGELRWRKAFGVADAGSGRPINDNTIFEAASMSKPVFAYRVMKLAEMGIIDLDEPLTKYKPGKFLTGDSRLDLITARHVLSHCTGFPNWRSSTAPLRIGFAPGEKYGYSGEGYYYLQSVVTYLTGREDRSNCQGGYEGDLEVCVTDIAAYMKKNLLDPLGMHSSSYVPQDPFAKRMALGHDIDGKPKAPGEWKASSPARYAAAGGLLTTASDYARFLIEVMRPKPADAFRLTRKSLSEMLRPHTGVALNDGYKISYALGWRVAQTTNGELTGHGGDNPGFHCLAEVSVARKSGFVIMTNGDGGVDFLKEVAPAVSRRLQPL